MPRPPGIDDDDRRSANTLGARQDASGSPTVVRLPREAREAYRRLFHCHADAMHDAALRVVLDPAAADDAVQRVFFRMMARPHSYDGQEITRAYLEQAATNEAISMLRQHHMEEPLGPAIVQGHADPEPGPLERVARDEARRLLEQWVEGLPPRCREVVTRVLFGQLTQREVAAALGIGMKAVEKQMTRAYRLARSAGLTGDPVRKGITRRQAAVSTIGDGGRRGSCVKDMSDE